MCSGYPSGRTPCKYQLELCLSGISAAILAIILVLVYLPNDKIGGGKGPSLKLLKRFHPSVVGMFLVMLLFFIYPTRFAISAHYGTTLSGNAIKYIAPVGFIIGYALLSLGSTLPLLLTGSAVIGIANGIGVPYLNTIAAMKAGREAASTVMPLLSAALYLGQFMSPLLVTPIGNCLFGSGDLLAPFKVGVLIGVIYLLQAFLTRNKQVVE